MNLKTILQFFSTQSIKEKIGNGTLTEGQVFIYFYSIFMYDALGLTQQCLSVLNKQPTTLDRVNIWGYLFVTGIGLLIVFIANDGPKGKNFVIKFFAFSFTVGYKYGIALILLNALASYLPAEMLQAYQIFVYFILNSLMVINIAWRMYESRQNQFIKSKA